MDSGFSALGLWPPKSAIADLGTHSASVASPRNDGVKNMSAGMPLERLLSGSCETKRAHNGPQNSLAAAALNVQANEEKAQ
jgi:hypothetical protein